VEPAPVDSDNSECVRDERVREFEIPDVFEA
jgi:hypothetical protein